MNAVWNCVYDWTEFGRKFRMLYHLFDRCHRWFAVHQFRQSFRIFSISKNDITLFIDKKSRLPFVDEYSIERIYKRRLCHIVSVDNNTDAPIRYHLSVTKLVTIKRDDDHRCARQRRLDDTVHACMTDKSDNAFVIYTSFIFQQLL